MTTLSDLTERVEKATEGSRELDSAVHAACGMHINPNPSSFEYGRWPEETARRETFYRIAPVSTSIDAALALVERVLPGFDYIIEHTNGGLTISCLLGTADPDRRVFANTPALAIILALLRSLQAGAQN